MPHFEIHGDEENGVTVRIGDYVRTFDLRDVREQRIEPPFTPYDEAWRQYPDTRLTLDLYRHRQPEPLDATPTVYGEGVWLH